MHSTKQVMLIAHPGIVRIAASRSVTLQPRLCETRIISTVMDVKIVIYIVRVLYKFQWDFITNMQVWTLLTVTQKIELCVFLSNFDVVL